MAEWEAYYLIEPFGEYYEFWRAGLICSMIANLLRGKDQKVAKPEDFIPDVFKDKKKQSTSEMKILLEANFQKKGKNPTKKDYLRAKRKRGIKKKKRKGVK